MSEMTVPTDEKGANQYHTYHSTTVQMTSVLNLLVAASWLEKVFVSMQAESWTLRSVHNVFTRVSW